MPHNYPKLHNAMWPGIVGKGAPEPSRSSRSTPSSTLTANAEADGQKFDGVDLFVTAPHFDIDSDPDAVKRMADHIAGYGLAVGSFVAPIWAGAGGGSAMGSRRRAQAVPHPGPQGLRDRPPDARARHPPHRRHPRRLVHLRRSLGQGPEGQLRAHRRDLPRGRRHRRRPRRVPRRRRRDLLGRHAFLAHHARPPRSRRPPRPRRLPGRHGPLDALHPRLQRRGRPHPPRGLRLDRHRRPRRRLHAGRRRAAPLDPRLPRRPERRHRLRLRRPREDRPPLPRRRPQRPPRHRQARRLLAARRRDEDHAPHLLGRLHAPERRDGGPATWNNVLAAMVKVRDAHGWTE